MSCLFASLIKDIRLFFSRKSSAAVLILPIALAAAMYWFTGNSLTSGSYVRPFKIAVRDYSSNAVSRSVINRIAEIELFDSVEKLNDDISDEEAFADDCAAVIVIPDGFFIAVYSMDNEPLEVSLNPDMPAEAEIVRALISSVVSIVTSEQTAWRAEYAMRCGEMTEEELTQFYYDSANYEFERAVSRSSVFESIDTADGYSSDILLYIYSTLCTVLGMLIPVCVLKSEAEERSLGIRTKLASAGAAHVLTVLSKFIVGLLIFSVMWAAVSVITTHETDALGTAGVFLGYASSFAVYAFLAELLKHGSEFQLCGNLFLIVSVLLAGALYPYTSLPAAAQTAAVVTIPYHVLRCISGEPLSVAVLACITTVFSAAALFAGRRRAEL